MESSSAALGWALEKETRRSRDAVDETFIGTAPASSMHRPLAAGAVAVSALIFAATP
jgi:hypothetical protein